MLRIGVLGRLSLELDGRAISPPVGRPAQTVLGWLALNPGTHSRATVAARLWPNVLDDSARGSLRVALVDLRRALGRAADQVLLATRDTNGLIDSPELEVDARRFAELLSAGEADEALRLWRGELLAGLDAGDWLLVLRDEYRDELSRALALLAERAASSGDRERAMRLARERVALDPFSEDATRDLMRRLASTGDRAAAVRAYQALFGRLRSELRTAPSTPTRELAEAVRADDHHALQTPAVPATESSITNGFEGTGARSTFVGRNVELQRLLDCVQQRRRLAVIVGEPGAGKSRLAIELALAVSTKGVAVLASRCEPEPLTSYEPFVRAIREYVARVGAASVAPVAGEELSRLLPELRYTQPERPAGEVAAAARLRLFEGVRATLEHAARRRPLLLVLDDLHWADQSSTLLLAYLARTPIATPVTIIGAYRPDALRSDDPLTGTLTELDREQRFPTVDLPGLDATAATSIVADVIGAQPDENLLAYVLGQTRGNPFFVEQLARHLSESGALAPRDGITGLEVLPAGASPAGVRSLVRSRVERLGQSAMRALELAAAAGAEFSLALLQRVRDVEVPGLLEGLESAEAAGLIKAVGDRPGLWMFKHALVRAAIYEALPDIRRARLHSQIADALEHHPGIDPIELAHHAFAARGVDGPERAIRTSRLAAEHTLTGLAYEQAANHYQRALQALEQGRATHPREQCELLIALGEAQARSAEREADATFIAAEQQARALADPELIARGVLGRCGIGVTILGADAERAGALKEALQALGDRAPALRARILARLAIELYYATERKQAGPLSRQAINTARSTDDVNALLAALSAHHVALWTPEGLPERLAVAEEMIALAREHNRCEHELQGRNWLCADLWEAGEINRFEQQTGEHAQLAGRLRLPTFRWYEPLWHAALAALRGEWQHAEQLLAEAERAGTQAGDRNAPLFAFGLRVQMRIARHQFTDDDLEIVEHHVQKSPASPAWRCWRCWFAAQAGNLAQARADLAILARDGFAGLPRDANWLAAIFELTQAVYLLNDRHRAGQLYDMLPPFKDRHVTAMRGSFSWGSAQYTLARLASTKGNLDDAARHYEAALELERRWKARAWLVRTRTHYAELLVNRAGPGDRDLATDLAHEAIAQAHTLDVSAAAIPGTVRELADAALQRS